MRYAVVFFTFLVLSFTSCVDEPEDIPELCFDHIEYHWTVNGEFQEIPGGEDPFTGGNPNLLFSIRTQGDWSVIFNSKDYFFNFNQIERVISLEELGGLSDQEFKEALENRARGDLNDILRVDFTIHQEGDSSVSIGKDQLVEGHYFINVAYENEKNCCFLDLSVHADFEKEMASYEMDFRLKTPFNCQTRH